MALVDSSVRGIDDHEHLGGELRGLAVEDDAWDFNAPIGVGLAQIEVQPGEPMLAVDDQKRRARQGKVAHLLVLTERTELELFGREQQHCARHHRLIRLVTEEVADLANFAPVQLALKRAGAALDLAHEPLDVVDLRGSLAVRRLTADHLAPLAVKARLESNAAEQVLGPITHEIEFGVLLAHSQGEHGGYLGCAAGSAPGSSTRIAPGDANAEASVSTKTRPSGACTTSRMRVPISVSRRSS